MDAFKQGELERMRVGGNARWRKFWEGHEDTKVMGLTWDGSTVKERYDSAVGEEYKERLSAEVEGRPYQAPAARPAAVKDSFSAPARSGTNSSMSGTKRDASPAGSAMSGTKAKVDDAYFSRLGNANAARPEHLPPSQGGKYAGFGSDPFAGQGGSTGASAGPPGLDELQRDPVAAITKGWGWFGGVVSKSAKQVSFLSSLPPISLLFSLFG